MTPVAPRIVNSVSYVTRINDEGDFSWQAQYLVKLNCHFSWQVQFGEVELSLFVAGAVFGEVESCHFWPQAHIS